MRGAWGRPNIIPHSIAGSGPRSGLRANAWFGPLTLLAVVGPRGGRETTARRRRGLTPQASSWRQLIWPDRGPRRRWELTLDGHHNTTRHPQPFHLRSLPNSSRSGRVGAADAPRGQSQGGRLASGTDGASELPSVLLKISPFNKGILLKYYYYYY